MADETDLLMRMYDCFNARDIDGVLATVADNVVWANAMDGGHENGREAVRDYWSRQFEQVRVQVDPVSFTRAANNTIVAEVEQSVFDLEGNTMGEDAHSLKAKTVRHVFRFVGGKVAQFDVEET